MTGVSPAEPWLRGWQVGAPAALHPLQAGRGARRASDPAPPAGVTKRTSSGGGGGGPHASAGALAAEAEAGRAAAAAAATCGASADEGAAPKIKPKRASAHLMRAVLLPRTTDRPQLPSRCSSSTPSGSDHSASLLALHGRQCMFAQRCTVYPGVTT